MWAAGRKEAQGKQIGLPFHTVQRSHPIHERYHGHPHPVTLLIKLALSPSPFLPASQQVAIPRGDPWSASYVQS